MSLTIGTRLGSYEITAAIGAGGRGEVYRARDTKLNRDVAIKVLPEVFALDAERLARFTREAQTLAALNHPNIAHIHGLEESPSTGSGQTGVRALVMELVDGEDLAARIAPGPMPIDELLPIARQIAEALEAAHEQGIIHRDLKPANIKVRPNGTVKVLDFGLAKAMDPAGVSGTVDVARSPTFTAHATQMGVIIGTAAYMAPEQARGKVVDKRADIWAFGAVLYEMLTGRRAFDGEATTDVLAAVLRQDIDWTALPAGTPPRLRRLLERCLTRDPHQRLRDIGEARILLGDADAFKDQPAVARAAEPSSRRPLVPWFLAGLGLVVAAVALASNMSRAVPAVGAVRFNVSYPPNVRPLSNGSDYHGAAISPDGVHVAFSGADATTGKVAIYVRRIDAVVATLVAGTEGGRYPFWSPDSRSIAFYGQGQLKRIDIHGGSLQVICDAPTGGWGGAWNTDDEIIAGITDPGPLVKVSAKAGSTPSPVTKIEPGESDHDWPQFLPDGRHLIYSAWMTTFGGNGEDGFYTAYLASLDSPDRKILFKGLVDPVAYADPSCCHPAYSDGMFGGLSS